MIRKIYLSLLLMCFSVTCLGLISGQNVLTWSGKKIILVAARPSGLLKKFKGSSSAVLLRM